MKFKVDIEERVTYVHTVIVEAENENDVADAASIIESDLSHLDDIVSTFDAQDGIEVIELSKDEDGYLGEFECVGISEY